MRSFTLLLALAVIHASTAAPWWMKAFGLDSEEDEVTKPDFCKSYECPEYTVVDKFDGYEERRYEKTVWVNAKLPAMASEYWEDTSGMSQTFMKLFRYIQGANDQQQKMDMTVPVVMTHSKDAVYMGFLVPQEFANNVPTPTDSDLEVYEGSAANFYVKEFGGWSYGLFGHNYNKDYQEELMKEVLRDNKKFDERMFFTASYNSPWDLWKRHNEVWLVKK